MGISQVSRYMKNGRRKYKESPEYIFSNLSLLRSKMRGAGRSRQCMHTASAEVTLLDAITSQPQPLPFIISIIFRNLVCFPDINSNNRIITIFIKIIYVYVRRRTMEYTIYIHINRRKTSRSSSIIRIHLLNILQQTLLLLSYCSALLHHLIYPRYSCPALHPPSCPSQSHHNATATQPFSDTTNEFDTIFLIIIF